MVIDERELKRWTILNVENDKVWEVSHEEFKRLINMPSATLQGKYMVIYKDEQKIRVWIDLCIHGKILK